MDAIAFDKRPLGEGCEIGARRAGVLVAVITHPMPRADWFVHWADHARRRGRFKTCKAAQAAIEKDATP